MASKPRELSVGLRIRPDTTGYTLAREGEIKIDSTLLKIYLDSAIRTLVSTDQVQALTNKTLVVSSNTITTAASGNLAATELNAALDELQDDIDTRATSSDLTNHMSDTTTHGTVGDIVGTSDTQTLTNKTIVASSNTITTAASGNLTSTELNAALDELQDDIDTRLSGGALTAHEGDTSTHGITSTIVGISETQTLTNKTIVAASNTITTAASGNLVATELNAALAELQGDIDSRALSSDLTTHMSDTTTHGTTGDIVGTSDAQVLTNKDIDGGTASNTNRLTLPKAAKATLDALTRKEGTVVYGTDTDLVYYDDGSTLTAVGAGGGGSAGSPDTIFIIDADDYTDTSTFATGDGTIVNGSALPGGTLQGTFARNTSSSAEGTADWKYTQAAGSLDSYIFSDAKTIDPAFRGKDVGINIIAKYDGVDNDIVWIVFDETNDNILTPSDFYVKSSTVYKNYQVVFSIPSTCASIRVGLQVKVLNSGKILEWDMMSVYDRPFIMGNINDTQSLYLQQGGSSLTDRTGHIRYDLATATYKRNINPNSLFVAEDYPTLSGTRIRFLRACQVDSFFGALSTASGRFELNHYNSANTIISTSYGTYISNQQNNFISVNLTAAAGDYITVSEGVGTGIVNNGDSVDWHVDATAQNQAIITPQTPDNTEISVDGTNGYGSTNTFIRRYSNIRKNTGTAVTYADSATLGASWTINETGFYTISSTDETGAGYSTVGFTKNYSTNTNVNSITPALGLLRIGGGAPAGGTFETSWSGTLNAGDVIRVHTSGNLSTTYSLGGMTIAYVGHKALSATPVDRVCYFKDSKAANSDGGTFTSGSYVTRTINTLSGDTSFAVLASNQITLPPGTYDTEIKGCTYQVGKHKMRLRNITDSTDTIVGTLGFNSDSDGQNSWGFLEGGFTITSSKVFEVQHRCSTTETTTGFGFGSAGSFGDEEIFLIGWIKKIK